MFSKNRKRIRQLRIQLERDQHLLELLKEELYITKDVDDRASTTFVIEIVKERMAEKRAELWHLLG